MALTMATSLKSIGGWNCYVCKESSGKRVVLIEGTPNRYYCEDCLWEAVQQGVLVVSLPGAEPTAAAANSVSLPVETREDGSIKVGDIEVRW